MVKYFGSKFISSNFSEILQSQSEKLMTLSMSTIESIIDSPNLQLENEDQLLKFINELYNQLNEHSILYEYVYFSNVKCNTIEEFINFFDINDLNQSIWNSITNRLKEEIKNTNTNDSKRYKSKYNQIMYKSDKDFEGIFHFLINNSIQAVNFDLTKVFLIISPWIDLFENYIID